MTEKYINLIRGSIAALGEKGTFTAKLIDKGRAEVFRNGERYGIYDYGKRTFVD